MKTFCVTYETRARGSIGTFEATSVSVHMFESSYCEADVIRDAFNQLQLMGTVETRFPLRCTEVTEGNL